MDPRKCIHCAIATDENKESKTATKTVNKRGSERGGSKSIPFKGLSFEFHFPDKGKQEICSFIINWQNSPWQSKHKEWISALSQPVTKKKCENLSSQRYLKSKLGTFHRTGKKTFKEKKIKLVFFWFFLLDSRSLKIMTRTKEIYKP